MNRVLQFGSELASRARRACFQLRLGGREFADRAFAGQCKFRQTLAEEYARGYMAGWRECFQSCIDAVAEEIAAADDVDMLRAAQALTGPPAEKAN